MIRLDTTKSYPNPISCKCPVHRHTAGSAPGSIDGTTYLLIQYNGFASVTSVGIYRSSQSHTIQYRNVAASYSFSVCPLNHELSIVVSEPVSY